MPTMIELLKISIIAFMFVALGDKGMIFRRYRKAIRKLPQWLYFPLGGCYLCFTGQACFWYYIVVYFKDYNLIDHLFFVSGGIFLSSVYHKLYCWMR